MSWGEVGAFAKSAVVAGAVVAGAAAVSASLVSAPFVAAAGAAVGVGMVANAAINHFRQGLDHGRQMNAVQALALGAGDASGLVGGYEAYTGRETFTGRKLTGEERASRAGEIVGGAVGAIAGVAGVRMYGTARQPFRRGGKLRGESITGDESGVIQRNRPDLPEGSIDSGSNSSRYIHPGPGAAVSGEIFKHAWIKRDLFSQLRRLVGKADFNKFKAALKKGVVGPTGESGIKILRNPVRGYTHELKIGGSAQRILGRIDDNSVLVFEEFIRGGLH